MFRLVVVKLSWFKRLVKFGKFEFYKKSFNKEKLDMQEDPKCFIGNQD